MGKANNSDDFVNYLDLTFSIDSNKGLSTKLYGNGNEFNFHIVNLLFLSSNVSYSPSYVVHIAQLKLCAKCCL